MKKYVPRITAALLALAVGVSLAALLPALSGVRLSTHYVRPKDLVDAALAFAAGATCYVLVAAGWRELRRDWVFNVLFFLIGSVSLAFCLWKLTNLFTFGGAEVLY